MTIRGYSAKFNFTYPFPTRPVNRAFHFITH